MEKLSRHLLWILWPAFLAAGMGLMLIFAMFDPSELVLFGNVVALDRPTTYTIGFFLLWLLAALSSGLTLWLSRSGHGINTFR